MAPRAVKRSGGSRGRGSAGRSSTAGRRGRASVGRAPSTGRRRPEGKRTAGAGRADAQPVAGTSSGGPGRASSTRGARSSVASGERVTDPAAKIDPGAATRDSARTSSGSKRFAGDTLERVWVPDRESWRAWLEKHQAREAGVWLVSFKKATGKPRVEYEHAVEEALCFGWIDSLVRTLDDERAMQLFTPRKPRSPWSRPNKVRVERLIAAGLMRPAGLAKIEQARRDGSWDVYAVAESLELPPDLRAAFESGPPGARSSWDAFSPSSRRAILWWVHSAKRPETRAQRIAQVVSEAARGRRANFPEDRR